jgi:hypothetical protein
MIHLIGGYNSIFASADTLQGKFGVTASNVIDVGSGLVVDNAYAQFPKLARDHMASIGIKHGLTSHPAARNALWSAGSDNAGLVLASAMGGTSAIKAASIGSLVVEEAPRAAVNGVAFQSILDMQSTIDALGGGTAGPRTPDRAITLAGMTGAQKASQNALASSPTSLASMKNGYAAAIDTLKQPVQSFDVPALKTAYGLTGTAVSSFASKMAAAELMVRAGTNVITVCDRPDANGRWDSHGDNDGSMVRTLMTPVASAVSTFLQRMMVQDTSRNVVVCILGDFARSLPTSGHQPNLSVTVMGKYVKQGTTGKVNAQVGLPNAPPIAGLWAYLAAVTKTTTTAFGTNPHALVL